MPAPIPLRPVLQRQTPDDLSGGSESKDTRNECGGSESGCAVHLETSARLLFRPAGPIGPGKNLRLRGIHTRDAKGLSVRRRKAILPPQLAAHEPQQIITAGLCKIGAPHCRAIPPSPCPAHGQDRHAGIAAARNDECLDGRTIDGIDDKIIASGEETLRIRRR